MVSKPLALLLAAVMAFSSGCQSPGADSVPINVELADGGIQVDGAAISTDPASPVYLGANIIYYQDGTDATYGEGEEGEKHTASEAAAHQVVTITQPGTYRLSGTLSQGQIAVDLGEDAKDDPAAVVTLVLDNANVTCTVAPALIFYNVYECDRAFVEGGEGYEATYDVDTAAAGANVVLLADTQNTFTGSHVARIYQPGTTENLHRYDGAFYSRMSMNILGDNGDDSGVLNIVADNEGLDTELHLTLSGGTVNIHAQDDGINTNEDTVSVTTVSGGRLTVNAGNGAEGDGIDSNGWLVINGGSVVTLSNHRSADGGIDADRGILINGGSLSAFGVRNDAADAASQQPYMELSFQSALPAGSEIALKDQSGATLWSATTQKSCQTVTLTTPELALDTPYRLYVDGVAQGWSGNAFGMMGGGMGQRPEGFDPAAQGQRPEGMPEPPEGFDPAQRPSDMPQRPQGEQNGQDRGRRPDAMPEPPEGFTPGERGPRLDGSNADGGQLSGDFTLTAQVKSFSGVRALSD